MNKFIKNPFVNLQEVAMTALCIVLAGCLISCTSKSEVDENVTDPETTILGKWELVYNYNQTLNVIRPFTPNGYIEYLPDGSLAWYDYAIKVYTLFEEKYWLNDIYVLLGPEHRVDDGIVLHYETTLKEVEYATGEVMSILVGPSFPDKDHGNQFHLTFKDSNTMYLYSLEVMSFAGTEYFIYKRKK